MNWVTWESVGVDRLGCAWLITSTPRRSSSSTAATDSQRARCDIDRVEIDGRDILLLTST